MICIVWKTLNADRKQIFEKNIYNGKCVSNSCKNLSHTSDSASKSLCSDFCQSLSDVSNQ